MPKFDARVLPTDDEEVMLLANTLLTFLGYKEVGKWLMTDDVMVADVVQKQLAATLLSRAKPALAYQRFLQEIAAAQPTTHTAFLWNMLNDLANKNKTELANEHVQLTLAENTPAAQTTDEDDIFGVSFTKAQADELMQSCLLLFVGIRSALSQKTELPSVGTVETGEYDNLDSDGNPQDEPGEFKIGNNDAKAAAGAATALGEYHTGGETDAEAAAGGASSSDEEYEDTAGMPGAASDELDASGLTREDTVYRKVEFLGDAMANPPAGFRAIPRPDGKYLWKRVGDVNNQARITPLPAAGALTSAASLHSSSQLDRDNAGDEAAATSSLTPALTDA